MRARFPGVSQRELHGNAFESALRRRSSHGAFLALRARGARAVSEMCRVSRCGVAPRVRARFQEVRRAMRLDARANLRRRG
eukprot:10026869-Lingulodinium_polyedra.AAC.1